MEAGSSQVGAASIERAVAFAREVGTAQLVIARGADLLADEAFSPEPTDVYAVQKGLVSVMFGMAQDRGLLDLDDPVSDHLGAGWTHLEASDEGRLTVRAVLDMTTGLDAELRPLGAVGVTWRYDNVSYNYLKTVLEVVTGLPLPELSRAWVFDPLGMGSTHWVERSVVRPDGKAITGLVSTARDLARFGTMVLRRGDGLVPPAYVASLGRPGSEDNPAWGLCWWNNDQAHHRLPRAEAEVRTGPVVPGAPADTITARGAAENRLFVVPSLDLVVARTFAPVAGERPDAFDAGFWAALSSGDR